MVMYEKAKVPRFGRWVHHKGGGGGGGRIGLNEWWVWFGLVKVPTHQVSCSCRVRVIGKIKQFFFYSVWVLCCFILFIMNLLIIRFYK